MDAEQKVAFGFEMIAAMMPQLGAVGDDLVELIALIKGVTVAETGELDAIQCVKDVFAEEGMLDFFMQRLKHVFA
jgi:hypothetical protein